MNAMMGAFVVWMADEGGWGGTAKMMRSKLKDMQRGCISVSDFFLTFLDRVSPFVFIFVGGCFDCLICRLSQIRGTANIKRDLLKDMRRARKETRVQLENLNSSLRREQRLHAQVLLLLLLLFVFLWFFPSLKLLLLFSRVYVCTWYRVRFVVLRELGWLR